jgi:Na+-driven multidrug efflux pump
MCAAGSLSLRPLIGNKSFYREALAVMLPVTGQQLITSLYGFTDNLMVGMVDAASLSGVTVANKDIFCFHGHILGYHRCGGLLLSQYYGAGDKKSGQIIFALQHVAVLWWAWLLPLCCFWHRS